MSDESTQESAPDSSGPTKVAACFSCRRSKLKCIRASESAPCLKCQRAGKECETPEYHIGRYKGIKNKQSGLDKAVQQIERAIKKSKTGTHDEQLNIGFSQQDHRVLLRRSNEVLTQIQSLKGNGATHSATALWPTASESAYSTEYAAAPSTDSVHSRSIAQKKLDTGDLALENAEHPLQLLANTSEILRVGNPLDRSPRAASLNFEASTAHSVEMRMSAEKNIEAFFGSVEPRLDTGKDLDPIELGLVTISDAEMLFTFFYQNLSHTRWGLDPVLHTVQFVRDRSLFLFASMMNASALFINTTAALSTRLSNHCRRLAHIVIKSRFRSVEIVLAFMINIPWLPPGNHWADDDTCTYLAIALTVAIEISLEKIVAMPDGANESRLEGVARSDCIDAAKALKIDGFDGFDPLTPMAQRILRRRERTWLALFVLERGVCLARGRNYTLPMTPLVETCDNWHKSGIADTWDGSIVSVAVLRRDQASLIGKIKAICDTRPTSVSGSVTVQAVKREIESFFDEWYATWPPQIGDQDKCILPPYVEILASHTRLSMYSSVINHPSAPTELKQFFRTAGLSSALNVLRVAVQGEHQLKSMPNNTAIMISFAACFALRLSVVVNETRSRLAPSVRSLIEETADVLERIGGTPEHRKGSPALFARQLSRIVNSNPWSGDVNPQTNQQPISHGEAILSQSQYIYTNATGLEGIKTGSQSLSSPFEDLPFSGMSNDQIIEAINNAGVGLESLWDEFQFNESTGLEWLNWPT